MISRARRALRHRATARSPRSPRAFTLIELMIAVCIIGVLASVAVPGFNRYLMSARAAEIPANLSAMYKGQVAYWEGERVFAKGLAQTASGHCRLDDGGTGPMGTIPPIPPGPEKRTGDWSLSPGFAAIGFAPVDPVYGSYVWGHPPANDGASWGCGLKASDFPDPVLYLNLGVTDLDGDGIYGGYSLMVGIRGDQLFRQQGFGSINDGVAPMIGACPMCATGFVE